MRVGVGVTGSGEVEGVGGVVGAEGDPSDLVSEGLDAVGLAGIDMGEDTLQGAGGLGLDGMGSDDHLVQARMGVEVTGLGDGGDLHAPGIGEGDLDPTGMGSSGHHLGHEALGRRGLDTPGLDAGVDHHGDHHPHDDHHHHHHHHPHHDHHHHDDDDGLGALQPVLPAHVVDHPEDSIGSPSDKMFQ